MPAPIDVSFRADLSNLTKQLAQMPNVTEKEAKEMVKALEKQFKSAEKAAERAAKKTEAAFKHAGKGAGKATKATGELSEGMTDLGETAGDADSALKAIGGALGLISPEAEAAFSTIGELGGGLEGMIKSAAAGVGPLALLTAAVAAGAFAWDHYTKELEAAEQKADDMAEAARDMADAVSAFKATEARIELEHLVATGEEHIDTLKRATAADKSRAVGAKTMEIALIRQREAQDAYNNAKKTEAIVLKGSLDGTVRDAKAHTEAKAVLAAATNTLKRRTAEVERLKEKEQERTETIYQTIKANENSRKTTKRGSSALDDQAKAIEALISKTNQLTEQPRTKLEQMRATLEELTDAYLNSSDAVGLKLAPAIEKLNTAITEAEAAELTENLGKEAEKAAQRFDDLTRQAEAFAPATGSLDKARALMAELRSEIGSNADAAAKLVPVMDQLQQNIDRLETEEAQQKLQSLANTMAQFGSNITGALSNLAQLNLSEVTDEGRKSLERFDERAQGLGEQLETINARISESTDERVTAELEAEKALIEARLTANEQAKEKETQAANEAVARAFRLQKAANLSQIAMNTAVAVMRAFSDTGPLAGPAFAATIGALGATQAAIVSAQEPPTMHLGGMVKPDERMIRARVGEGVLTQQGMQAIGGEAGLRAANGGASAGGSIIVQEVYKHRVLDTVLTDSIRRGGPITAELNKRNRRGRRNPHRRAG
jgi:hypothetical protein